MTPRPTSRMPLAKPRLSLPAARRPTSRLFLRAVCGIHVGCYPASFTAWTDRGAKDSAVGGEFNTRLLAVLINDGLVVCPRSLPADDFPATGLRLDRLSHRRRHV